MNTGNHTARILLVGASTGGPEAVRALLAGIGPNFPLPVLVTQHIDAAFGASFPQWLAETTGVRVELARENVIPQPGCVYVAPPKRHLIVKKTWSASVCMLGLDDGPLVHFVRPSVDMLFMSAARVLGDGCLAVLLTGMGKDGAAGCRLSMGPHLLCCRCIIYRYISDIKYSRSSITCFLRFLKKKR